jgi:aerobic carbon-monoxide dehydrogenase large subunit
MIVKGCAALPSPLNPLGAKGAGEGGIMPVHPVIAQAVEDALAPFRARVGRVPVTRRDIWTMTRGGPAE